MARRSRDGGSLRCVDCFALSLSLACARQLPPGGSLLLDRFFYAGRRGRRPLPSMMVIYTKPVGTGVPDGPKKTNSGSGNHPHTSMIKSKPPSGREVARRSRDGGSPRCIDYFALSLSLACARQLPPGWSLVEAMLANKNGTSGVNQIYTF